MSYAHQIKHWCVNLEWETKECLLGECTRCSDRAEKNCGAYDDIGTMFDDYIDLERK